MHGLPPLQKRLLYQTCILPIALYGFQLWFYKNAPTKYHLHKFGKLQRRAALWITGAFRTSPSAGVEGIAGLIPISLHLRKLAGCSHLIYSTIPTNHAISSLLKHGHSPPPSLPHKLGLSNLTPKQKSKLRGPITDIDQRLIQVHPASCLSSDHIFSPGLRLVDKFSSQFSFFSSCSSSSDHKKIDINNLKKAFSSLLLNCLLPSYVS